MAEGRRPERPATLRPSVEERLAAAAEMLCRGVKLLNEVVAEVREGKHGDDDRGTACTPDGSD